jgi:hypothetical protein
MSIQLIQQYYNNVDKLIRYGGTRNEMSIRKAFQELLDHYARSKNLVLVPEVGLLGKRGRTVRPDGTLKDALRQDWGYWESKDEKDTLEDEIRTKFGKGYPDFNILFEDTHTAVLGMTPFLLKGCGSDQEMDPSRRAHVKKGQAINNFYSIQGFTQH